MLKNNTVSAITYPAQHGWPRLLARATASFRLELRLTCLHWSYPLLHAIWALIIFGQLSNDVGSARMILLAGMVPVVRTTISAIALFFAANSYARSTRNRFDGLENSYPVHFEVLFGRWCAVTLATFAFILEPMLLALVRGPFNSFLSAVPAYVIQTIIPLSFATALSWTLVILLRMRRWVFPLLAALWIGLITLPTILTAQSVDIAGLFNLTGNGTPAIYSELYGMLPAGNTAFWFTLFYLGLLLTLMFRLAFLHERQQSHRSVLSLGLLAILSAALALGSAAGFGTMVAAARPVPMYLAASSDNGTISAPFNVTDYQLTLDLTDASTPKLTARLVIHNRSTEPLGEIRLTLYHSFSLDQVSLPYQREADRLTLIPQQPLAPGADIDVQFSYSGALWKTEVWSGFPVATAFIRPEGVYLLGLAWYPRPDTLLSSGEFSRFTVTIRGADDLKFASNLPTYSVQGKDRIFSAQSASWVMIMGSPELEQESIDSIRLIAAEADVPMLEPLVRKLYIPRLEQIRRFFPDVSIQGVTLLSTQASLTLPYLVDLTDGWLVSTGDRLYLSRLKPEDALMTADDVTMTMLQSVIAPWGEKALFAPTLSNVSGDNWMYMGMTMNGAIGGSSLFVEVYLRTEGDARAMQQMLADLKKKDYVWYQQLTTTPETAVRAKVVETLSEIYSQGGDAAIVKTLRQIRLHGLDLVKLQPDQIEGWLKEAANGQ